MTTVAQKTSQWGQVPRFISTNRDLSDGAVRLFAYMASEANSKHRPYFRRSARTIGTHLGWGKTKVFKCIAELLKAGAIAKAQKSFGEVVRFWLRFQDESPAEPVRESEPPRSPERTPPRSPERTQIQASSNNHPQAPKARPLAGGGGQLNLQEFISELEPEFGQHLDGTDGRPTLEATVVEASGHPKIHCLRGTAAKRAGLINWVKREVTRMEEKHGKRSPRRQDAPTASQIARQLLEKTEEQQRNACAPEGGFAAFRRVVAAQQAAS